MKVTIILPVYNEANSLSLVLERIERSVVRVPVAYRIILVDDGSTDGSPAIARSLARVIPMHIVSHARNEGLGKTVRDGLRLATQEYSDDAIVIMDADNSQPPELIPEMLARLQAGFDVVVASRYTPGARSLRVPLHRKFFSRLGNIAYFLWIRAKGVRDYTCAFRTYEASFLKKAWHVYGDGLVSSSGFECMAEILIKLWWLGARIVEIPFTLDYGAKPSLSKMKLARTIPGNLRVLALTRRLRRTGSSVRA